MSKIGTREREKSELYIALRYKVRSIGISRVDMLCYEHNLGEAVPKVEAKVPIQAMILTDPSQIAKLGHSKLWDGYEERAWRRSSPMRLQRRMDERTRDFQSRLDSGEMVVAAVLDDEFVGAVWFCLKGRKADPVVDSFVDLSDREVLLYQSQVDRSVRGKRIYKMLVSVGLNRLRELGFQKVSVHIEADNTPSIVAIESLGFKPVRLIRFRRLFSSVRHDVVDLAKTERGSI